MLRSTLLPFTICFLLALFVRQGHAQENIKIDPTPKGHNFENAPFAVEILTSKQTLRGKECSKKELFWIHGKNAGLSHSFPIVPGQKETANQVTLPEDLVEKIQSQLKNPKKKKTPISVGAKIQEGQKFLGLLSPADYAALKSGLKGTETFKDVDPCITTVTASLRIENKTHDLTYQYINFGVALRKALPQELVLRLGLHKKLTPNRYAFNKWVFSPKKTVKKATKVKKGFIEKLAPIFILLLVVGIVIFRLPAVEGVNHSKKFRIRRIANWLPLGLTYAFLYMARYNLKVSQHGFGDMKD